jgi:peroxiredoxin
LSAPLINGKLFLEMKKVFIIITVLIGIPLLFYCTGFSLPKTNSLAPDFTLNDIDGNKVTLSELRGNVVILNFWSIWCGPCLAEMPSLNTLFVEFKDKGLIVFAVAEDPAEKPVRAYIEEKKLALPILMDKKKEVYFKYTLFGIPVSFLINKKGVIVERFIGESDWCSLQMREKVLQLLNE